MFTFMESRENTNEETEKCLDSHFWHACAGSMVQMPSVNSNVFYFPQGHSEHSSEKVDFRNHPKIPAYVPCKVSAIKFMADPQTDEVFAKIRLVPISGNEVVHDDNAVIGINGSENEDKQTKFAKTLTQSDANNGGGFSVPRYCAETIFPRLDYSADPPVQTILAKDVHGKKWQFRHIYRGTPRRHLLTTGWSNFVNQKKLVAGDSIVFLRAENGELCVGIKRARRGNGNGVEIPSGWGPYGGFSAFLREGESKLSGDGNGRVKGEDVIEAATLAANGRSFDVVYYPQASTPEFCVKASLVKAAMQMRWCSGMRFKMAFETEDSSRISWFMGTISSVQVADPIRWPDSPWRLLQVAWDEPDLLQNVKRVNPWLVELVSNMQTFHLSPFSPPRKKMRLPEYPLEGQIPLPAFSANHHFIGSSNPFPAGMQGARHAQYGLSLSDHHLNKLQSSLFPISCLPMDRASGPTVPSNLSSNNENVSCLLTIGNSTPESTKPNKSAPFLLFGKPILTEKQISMSCSSNGNSSSDGSGSGHNQNEAPEGSSCEGFQSELGLENGQCKVFMESEDVGRTLDLSLIGSYEELYTKLSNMFGIEISEIMNRVLYQNATGAARQLGDEPFSTLVKVAKRLTILADSSSDNVVV
ncbi:hypothetical protein ACJIZ3_024251 [Penstemon smallii]|uniref:Auxin response factor n=1 Tax=Penstemon smallii TaxID=265156 RepID=A0ABD3TRH4_9LAMI